jgi:multidrug efflux pump subunit AcrB
MNFDDHQLMHKGLNRAQLLAELRSDITADGFYGKIMYLDKPMFIRAVNVDASDRKEHFLHKMRFINGVWVRLNEVSTLEKEKTLARINRKNQQYSRVITFEYLSSWERGQAFQKEVVNQFVTPLGVQIAIPDFWSRFRVNANQEESNRWYVLIGALGIVLLIIAGLLNQWKPAFATLGFVILGLIGVVWAALEFDLTFGRGAYAGVLLLGGVIVNNGLLLYHEKIELEKKGILGLRNGLYVLKAKLRSVWLTTLTTLAGLFPLLLWSSDPFWSGMALIVCSGMAFSTVMITLFWGSFTR